MAKAKQNFTAKENKELLNMIASDTGKAAEKGKAEEYRFNARFTRDQWRFLTELKWTTRQSITAILQSYVEEDMKKRPEILENADELNG